MGGVGGGLRGMGGGGWGCRMGECGGKGGISERERRDVSRTLNFAQV